MASPEGRSEPSSKSLARTFNRGEVHRALFYSSFSSPPMRWRVMTIMAAAVAWAWPSLLGRADQVIE